MSSAKKQQIPFLVLTCDFDWFGPIISTRSTVVVSFYLSVFDYPSLFGPHQNADGMLSRFQSLNDWRPPGESDEWYPALLLFPPKKRTRGKNFSSTITPLSTFFSLFFHFFFFWAKQNTFNEPTRMTPLQSERATRRAILFISHPFIIRADTWALFLFCFVWNNTQWSVCTQDSPGGLVQRL